MVVLPTGVGGGTSYVTTFGASMEPMFRAGDLAVVRSAAGYDVGDVVAYQSPTLRRIVLHRIVGRQGDRFTFQGDNELRIAVVPTVDIDGTVAGVAVEDRFQPSLGFAVDDVALRPVASGESELDGFTPTREATVTVHRASAAVLPVPLVGADPTVTTARTVGLAGGAALPLLGLALVLSARSKGDGSTRIAARHRSLLVPIRDGGGEHGRTDIELAAFEDLARVAEHHGRLVLHHVVDGHPTYLVVVQGDGLPLMRGGRPHPGGR